ncbi:antibiotic transporter [Skermania sp. ID1734]|uniref:ABC transporter permease n=1 Tax=Skermania sp. ID1734 TaxID=2597516 RepID=UPI00117E14F3|nr:ABC transporter permease [Skermania sp. ID1734]TSE02161.1 antibiotic transporter [Skermania sp. ID1734]
MSEPPALTAPLTDGQVPSDVRLGWSESPPPKVSGLQQWWALTARILAVMVKTELPVAIITPLIFTLGFYLPLRYVMKFQGIDYAQFVMPIIVLNTMSFTMNSVALRSAYEAASGLSDRMRTMPISALAPFGARIVSGVIRSIISLIAALLYGYAIGFRFVAGFGQAVLFCAFSLAVGTMLSIGADGLGSYTKSPEALSQALTLPVIIFGMLSTGFVPETGFPHWIRPFVRNQPISQFSVSMRDMAEHGVSFHVLWPSLIWLGLGFLVFTPFAVWVNGRRG